MFLHVLRVCTVFVAVVLVVVLAIVVTKYSRRQKAAFTLGAAKGNVVVANFADTTTRERGVAFDNPM